MMRDKKVTIRLTQDEYNKLNNETQKLNMSMSELIRHKILNKKVRVKSKLSTQAIYELNRIGNNLNQIAKHCNITKTIDKLVLQQLVDIEKELKNLLEKV